MLKIPINCGHKNSIFTSNSHTLYLTKYDDGRFEYYGKITIPGGEGNAKVNHPFTPIFVVAMGSNFFSNTNNNIVSASANTMEARVDVMTNTGLVPQRDAVVNLFVKGTWK